MTTLDREHPRLFLRLRLFFKGISEETSIYARRCSPFRWAMHFAKVLWTGERVNGPEPLIHNSLTLMGSVRAWMRAFNIPVPKDPQDPNQPFGIVIDGIIRKN